MIEEVFSGVSILGVSHADIGTLGALDFYSKEEIKNNMLVFYSDFRDKRQRLSLRKTFNPDLEIFLAMFKPVMESAGRFGTSVHFFVINDQSNSSRVVDPYREGKLEIQLMRRDGVLMTATIEMPLNSLFVPRICPTGKEAHVSWNYCPWTGEPLE